MACAPGSAVNVMLNLSFPGNIFAIATVLLDETIDANTLLFAVNPVTATSIGPAPDPPISAERLMIVFDKTAFNISMVSDNQRRIVGVKSLYSTGGGSNLPIGLIGSTTNAPPQHSSTQYHYWNRTYCNKFITTIS